MKRNVYIIGICVILLLSSGGYLYGGQTTGVTDKSIKIGCLVDLTGPSSFLGRSANTGAESYFKYINDRGGIHGRKVMYVAEDNKYQPATAVAGLKKLVYRDKIFAICFSWGTVSTLAITNDVERDKIPTIYVGNSESMLNPLRPYIFSFLTTYYRQAFTVADYIVNTMKAKDLRFACIYQDDETGKSGLRGFKKAAKLNGAKWVGEAPHKRGAINLTPQVLSLKKAGATFIYLPSVTRQAATILKEAKKLDWHPQFFGASATTDKKVLELAGNASKGYMGCTYVVGWHEEIPGLDKVRRAVLKYHGTLKGMTDHTGSAWAGAMLISEGLKRAGRSLTRDGLVHALETIKDFDPDGLMPPVTWGPNRREGQIGTRILKLDFERKIFEPVTGWIIPEY